MVRVKGYTRKLKGGKRVRVSGYNRKNPKVVRKKRRKRKR